MKPSPQNFRNDRGSMLIHVAFALLGLMAFSSFVLDYGVMWTSRRQAQSSADSGALAGVIALGFDTADFTNVANMTSTTGVVKTSAIAMAQKNRVWGQAPDVQPSDVTVMGPSAIGFATQCPDDPTGYCVRVDVYRNTARGNPLPMFFGALFNKASQGVRATATAKLGVANSSNCLKPWGVADKWTENNPTVGAPWTGTSTYDPTGPHPDVYTPQDGTSAGSGFKIPDDVGTRITLKVGDPHDAINPGWFQALDLTGGGGSQYRSNISGCAGTRYGIGDDIPKENGNMVGPTDQGTDDLIARDPNASWDATNKRVINSCAYTGACPGSTYSPRIVAIPVFNLDLYLQTGGPGNGTVRIVNILGFFVESVSHGEVVGVLVLKPELYFSGEGGVSPSASFIHAPILVR